jgi:hypothetical protein
VASHLNISQGLLSCQASQTAANFTKDMWLAILAYSSQQSARICPTLPGTGIGGRRLTGGGPFIFGVAGASTSGPSPGLGTFLGLGVAGASSGPGP